MTFEQLTQELCDPPNSWQDAIRHAGVHYIAAEGHVKATDHLATCTERRRNTRAELIEPLRAKLIAGGQRPTDATIEDALQLQPAYREARNAEIAAETQEALWRALRESHAQRAQHLDNIYSTGRLEK